MTVFASSHDSTLRGAMQIVFYLHTAGWPGDDLLPAVVVWFLRMSVEPCFQNLALFGLTCETMFSRHSKLGAPYISAQWMQTTEHSEWSFFFSWLFDVWKESSKLIYLIYHTGYMAELRIMKAHLWNKWE